ncbi:MAG: VanZ family protein [Oscillospiraceae bacterium]|nr:VanZ family protein [Oscillospiraceae bacterium]
MSLSGILLYSRRAFVFALAAGLLWSAGYALSCRKNASLRQARPYLLSLLFVCYLAALFQITVIRDWNGFFHFSDISRSWATVQLVPLRTTLEEAGRGLWPFLYHVAGNMIWFLPLGVLGPMTVAALRRPAVLLGCSAALSAAIEALQWLFGSGASDIDDLLLNICGAMLGWVLWRLARSIWK